MSRFIYHGTNRDGSGNVISDATVTVYLAGTTTAATIYSEVSGGSAISGSAITTGTDGSFEFFVDSSDYATSQYFKVVLTKSGYATKTYDQCNIFGSSTSYPISIANGGTGAVSASAARIALGATTVGNALFTAVSAGAARAAIGVSESGTALQVANNLSDLNSAATARTNLGGGTTGIQLFQSASAGAARAIIGTIPITLGGTGATSASAARTELGLGDAAVEDVQASGAGDLLREDGDGSGLTGVGGGTWTTTTPVTTTSGTQIDFTGLSGVTDFYVNFMRFSLDGTKRPLVQAIVSGSPVTTGYTGESKDGGSVQSWASYTGAVLVATTSAPYVYNGYAHFRLVDAANKKWLIDVHMSAEGERVSDGDGIVTLSGALEGVRITSEPTPNNFDSGSVSVTYWDE